MEPLDRVRTLHTQEAVGSASKNRNEANPVEPWFSSRTIPAERSRSRRIPALLGLFRHANSCTINGRIALGFYGMEEVKGSNPFRSTNPINHIAPFQWSRRPGRSAQFPHFNSARLLEQPKLHFPNCLVLTVQPDQRVGAGHDRRLQTHLVSRALRD